MWRRCGACSTARRASPSADDERGAATPGRATLARLIASGPDERQERLRLRGDRTLLLGRAPTPEAADAEPWALPWEPALSRNHATLRWSGGGLAVELLPAARNPIFHRGRASDRFRLEPGDHFVVGDTTVSLVDDAVSLPSEESAPVEMTGYSGAELRGTRYSDAAERLEVLSHLPEVLRGAASDEELFSRLVLLLLEGIPAAATAAIVRAGGGEDDLEVFHWDGRDATDASFRPSRRLIREAIRERRQSVRSLWRAEGKRGADYTISDDLEWAFCTPVPGEACRGWGLYVAGGRGSLIDPESQADLRPDLKFAELVASILGAVRDLQQLQHRQSTLSRFFSPVTLPILSRAGGDDALAPRLSRVTILFCDLRGFSREAERSRDDLLGLLERVSRALDVMTECIHGAEGVLADFQGDAALAFWGWPIDTGRSAVDACRAALAIRERFAGSADDRLAGFRCGIGIASGEAVAGRLGTSGQFKIDVFGPVVNLASRLEGITKQVRVPVLLDESTVDEVRAAGGPAGGARFRRLARLCPYGMEQPLTVSELLPAAGGGEVLSDEDRDLYERALDAFCEGRWDEAFEQLHAVPHWDRGKDFLTTRILQHGRQPPPGWDGVIRLGTK